jgi:flagellar assembly protein FliH
MGAPAKFMFDTDFAKPQSAAQAAAQAAEMAAEQAAAAESVYVEPTITLAEQQVKLAEAEATAYRNGMAAAEAAARTEAERRTAQAYERIGQAIDDVARGLSGVEGRLESEAVEVAMAVARKLCPALIAKEPFAEISALAAECFRQIMATPHIVVRVNDDLYASHPVKDQLETIARNRGFEGRLIVLAEPEIAAGDCRIEWADGGITRDRAATEAVIGDAVGRYIAARRVATGKSTDKIAAETTAPVSEEVKS